MGPTEFRLEILAALYENGRQPLDELAKLVNADAKGMGHDEMKAAIDGLCDAGLVMWEALGDIQYRITLQGQDYLATARA